MEREVNSLPGKKLIILRGVPGAGKSMVARALQRKLGGDGWIIDLDKYAPDNETEKFEAALKEAAGHEVVIGELQSGRWHTTDAGRWVSMFKDYELHSFVLDVSEAKGYANSSDPRHGTYNPPSRAAYEQTYTKFYSRVESDLFAKGAQLKEKKIDAEDGDWERISSEILSEIRP